MVPQARRGRKGRRGKAKQRRPERMRERKTPQHGSRTSKVIHGAAQAKISDELKVSAGKPPRMETHKLKISAGKTPGKKPREKPQGRSRGKTPLAETAPATCTRGTPQPDRHHHHPRHHRHHTRHFFHHTTVQPNSHTTVPKRPPKWQYCRRIRSRLTSPGGTRATGKSQA